MEAKKFTEKIYGPYGEAWKIIKLLALAEDDNPKLSEVLFGYMGELQKFKEKYQGNAFAEALYNLMLNTDDIIMRMNRNEIPETKADK